MSPLSGQVPCPGNHVVYCFFYRNLILRRGLEKKIQPTAKNSRNGSIKQYFVMLTQRQTESRSRCISKTGRMLTAVANSAQPVFGPPKTK